MSEAGRNGAILAATITAVGAIIVALITTGGPGPTHDSNSGPMGDKTSFVPTNLGDGATPQGDNSAALDDDQTEGSPAPEPAPPAPLDTGAIAVDNECDHEVRIAIAYQTDNGWELANGSMWIVGANASIFPLFNGSRLYPISRDIYFEASSTDGEKQWLGKRVFTYNDLTFQMNDQTLVLGEQGTLRMALTCQDP
jgi:hypothetical protein